MLVHNFWETNGKETNWEFLQSLCISTNFGGQKWNRVDVMWWRRLPYSLCVLPSTAGGAIGVRLGPRPLTSLGIIFWDHHWKPLETIGNDTQRSSAKIGQIQKETDLLKRAFKFYPFIFQSWECWPRWQCFQRWLMLSNWHGAGDN